jgi:transcriptional regulator with XRE-family HTH domain
MINSDALPISAQIRELRKSRGLSLQELARRAGTSAPALHRYETGWDRFEIATLRRIAAALGARLEIRLKPEDVRRPFTKPSDRQLARLLAPLFWDRKLIPADLREYPRWVLGRVLMYGNMDQVRAARRFFGDAAIREAISQRGIDRRTRNYWTIMLGDPDASQGTERERLADRP